VWLDPDFRLFFVVNVLKASLLAIVQSSRSVSKSLVIHVFRGGYFDEVGSEIAFPVICN